MRALLILRTEISYKLSMSHEKLTKLQLFLKDFWNNFLYNEKEQIYNFFKGKLDIYINDVKPSKKFETSARCKRC